MGNLGGMEVVVIMLVALIVLGPKKLPEAARQVGRAITELKRISSRFQQEMSEAMHDPIIEAEARAKGARVVAPDPAIATPDPEAESSEDNDSAASAS